MAGKRLLDVAALFTASRGVLSKHAKLRSKQFEVYSQTSTLAQAIRDQTDRITETARAASVLASRLNEDAPAWTKDERTKKETRDPIPSMRSTTGPQTPQPREGLKQDHFYQKSAENSAANEPPTADLHIQQATANRYPLVDGTIPPSTEPIFPPQPVIQDVVSQIPRNEPSKRPLDHDGLEPVSSSDSTIPCPAESVSSTPANTRQSQPDLPIPSKTADALEPTGPEHLTAGHDNDSFYRRSMHSSSPVPIQSSKEVLPKHTSADQTRDPHLSGPVNSDSFYRTEGSVPLPDSSTQAVTEREDSPGEVVTGLFRSPRAATLLDGGSANDKDGAYQQKAFQSHSREPVDQTGLDDRPIRNGSSSGLTGGISHPQTPSSAEPTEVQALHSSHDLYELRESKVPATRLSRIWNYGGLAVGMLGGAVSESFRRVSGSEGHGSYMLSAGNIDRLVTKLSRMRGAALKLGQMISFQDSKMLPAAIQEVLQRVQDRADYMPPSQRDKVLSANLGPNWRSLFTDFDEKPIAAASIGQVHRAVYKADGAPVAVKIQYPGVADSINSDLSNLGILLTASRLLPKGLYLDKTIANARTELAWECDYLREAECGRRFEKLLADEKSVFVVPKVYPEASGKQVLTMEFMHGTAVTKVKNFSQEQRDWIGTQILRLCLREITEFRFMQTDPNWTNFLYNESTNKLELLDFGASREYPEKFISIYTRLLAAASRTDRQMVQDLSIELGYLTGQESAAMVNAHIASVLTLAEPFLDSSPEIYDFSDQTITDRVKEQIPLMIRERLSPPPEETYSLHRKLSGAFLLCARLGSRVRCRELFQDSMSNTRML